MIYATEQQVVVTSVLVCLVGLIAFTIGLWTGHGREREYVEQLEKELEDWWVEADRLAALEARPPEVAHEPWPVHVDQVLAVAMERDPTLGGKLHDIHGGPGQDCWCGYVGHDPVLTPTAVIPPDQDPSVTAWTKAMAADMKRFMDGLLGETDEKLREIMR